MMQPPMPTEDLAAHVSNLDRHVFAIQGLPEEIVAVLFAYYSRSPHDLRSNLSKLLASEWSSEQSATSTTGLTRAHTKAAAFHEKWVVGYGHSSVAEHAIVHLAVEDVSILGTKIIEDARLASFTEKSTRYVKFDTSSFVDLPHLPAPLRDAYDKSCKNLFQTYTEMFPVVHEHFQRRARPDTPKAAVHAQTCDALRGLLPASTKTNVGITINARALGALLTKMMSTSIPEFHALAEQMRREALTVCPTLLRHVHANDFRQATRQHAWDLSQKMQATIGVKSGSRDVTSSVAVLDHDPRALNHVLSALVYETSDPTLDAEGVRNALASMDPEQASSTLATLLKNRGPHDPVPRAFEHAQLTVELTLDYGAYRDLQRHRMLTPATRLLGCELGTSLSPDLERMGVASRVRGALEQAADTWALIRSQDPYLAQYAVPLAYRTRTIWTMNLREAFHIVELRSAKQGHTAYRRIAQELYRELCSLYPWIAPHMRVDLNDYAWAR